MLRAADALRAVAGDQVDVGQRLVPEVLQRDVRALQIRARVDQIGAALERAAHGAFDVGRRRLERRQIDRPQLLPPQRIVGAADDEALERELRRLQRRFGRRRASAGGWPLRLRPARCRAARACRPRRAPGCPRRACRRAAARAAATSTALRAKTRSQYALRTLASVCVTVARTFSSEISRLICVIGSCCRVLVDEEPAQQRLRVRRPSARS